MFQSRTRRAIRVGHCCDGDLQAQTKPAKWAGKPNKTPRLFAPGASQWRGTLMRIFLGNLPYTMSERELRDVLAEHVEIVHFDMKRDAREGRAQGYGWIVVADEEGAAALEKPKGVRIAGRKLRVEVAISSGRRYGADTLAP